MTPVETSVLVDSTVQLVVTLVNGSGGLVLPSAVTWESNRQSVATVSAAGLVTGKSVGTARVTARSGGLSAWTVVTVTGSAPGPQVLVGAGDIGRCGTDDDEATARLLDSIPGTVFTAGDNVYSNGSPEEFEDCYQPTWGRHRERTRPAPGNHDYGTRGARGYYGYFGSRAPGFFYSYDLGSWHVVSLNSEIAVEAGSPQERWLRADLAASRRRCTLAVWHRPRFSSSSSHGSARRMAPLWQALYDHRAEIVVSGHDHVYERFAPQTASGVRDTLRGVRQFVAGTGGASHYNFGPPLPNSEVRANAAFGVLKFVLGRESYYWQFLPVPGASFTDSGTGSCH